ncbi:MAG: hypothetical protein GY849_18815, partial [Deltaproteobacteria bacterium]|nr:hypothetical protein [Deltaproteobacteria bacterium]
MLSDVDNTNLASLTVTLTTRPDGADEELTAVVAGTSISLTAYDSGTGVLLLSGSDTVANYQQVLRTVRYENTSQDPTETARTVTFVADDGTDNSNTGTTTITVTGVNDAAVLDLDDNNSSGESGANYATTFTEDGGSVLIADTDAVLSDVDNTNLASLTVTLTTRPDGADEELTAVVAGTSISLTAYD